MNPKKGTVPIFFLALAQLGGLDFFDKNKDGKIAPAEFSDWIFILADAGRDGFLDETEIQNFRFGNGNKGEQKIPAKILKEQDKDGDGKISRAEFQAPSKFFDGWDKSKDGQLDDMEISRAGGPTQKNPAFAPPAEFFKKADRNGDGMLSKEEWERFQRPQFFDKADKNADGKLSPEEVTNAFVELRREGIIPSPDDFVARFDLDGDGKVSRTEFPGSDEVFERLDNNGDGVIAAADSSKTKSR